MAIVVRPLDSALQIKDSSKGNDFIFISYRVAFDVLHPASQSMVDVTGHFFRVPDNAANLETSAAFEHPDMMLPPRVKSARTNFGDPLEIPFTNNRPRSWLEDSGRLRWAVLGLIRDVTVPAAPAVRFGLFLDQDNASPEVRLYA